MSDKKTPKWKAKVPEPETIVIYEDGQCQCLNRVLPKMTDILDTATFRLGPTYLLVLTIAIDSSAFCQELYSLKSQPPKNVSNG